MAEITLPSSGAACIFTGIVRGLTSRNDPHETVYLDYEAYQPMAEAKMKQVAEEIRQRWPAVEGIAIVQRIGRLYPQTPTVVIACTAAHRDTGVFEAARYGIDRLKEIVPVWKKEVGPEGRSGSKVNTSLDRMTEVRCSNCGRPYPDKGIPYRCPKCTAHYDIPRLPAFDLSQQDKRLPGIWRYRNSFVLPGNATVVSLGEGNTPLLWYQIFGHQIGFKLEFLNPSGSYKDRGTAPLVSFLLSRGIRQAVEDSSGNAGASFAAYAAAAGIEGRVFVPGYASGPKLAQIAAYGADVVQVKGTRTQTTEAALKAVKREVAYASHAFMPFGLAGYATLAYELFEQTGRRRAASSRLLDRAACCSELDAVSQQSSKPG